MEDARGEKLLEYFGISQPSVSMLWKRLVMMDKPDIVLDIGANYGEVGLCCRYKPSTQIYFFEPNPVILPYLKKSIASHYNNSQMKMVDAAASNKVGDSILYINNYWSGTSSLSGNIDYNIGINTEKNQKFQEKKVKTVLLDEIILKKNYRY